MKSAFNRFISSNRSLLSRISSCSDCCSCFWSFSLYSFTVSAKVSARSFSFCRLCSNDCFSLQSSESWVIRLFSCLRSLSSSEFCLVMLIYLTSNLLILACSSDSCPYRDVTCPRSSSLSLFNFSIRRLNTRSFSPSLPLQASLSLISSSRVRWVVCSSNYNSRTRWLRAVLFLESCSSFSSRTSVSYLTFTSDSLNWLWIVSSSKFVFTNFSYSSAALKMYYLARSLSRAACSSSTVSCFSNSPTLFVRRCSIASKRVCWPDISVLSIPIAWLS